MARADAAAIAAGTSGLTLMERAGTAVADAVCARFERQTTTVLCGPGNNGGDGYVAARVLQDRGWPVEVRSFGEPATQDAQAMSARWEGVTKPLNGALEPGVWIDALFGAGLKRPLSGPAAAAAIRMAEAPERVVAVDVPSGVAGDTGKPNGPAACAALTVTFHAKKPAHLLEPGRSRCGEVVVADIGLGVTESQTVENGPELWLPRFPWPTAASHKHARGRLVVVSGEAWQTGAARLAARGALRIGAGLVTVLSPPEALPINASHLEAVMLKAFETDQELEQAAKDVDAAVIGRRRAWANRRC